MVMFVWSWHWRRRIAAVVSAEAVAFFVRLASRHGATVCAVFGIAHEFTDSDRLIAQGHDTRQPSDEMRGAWLRCGAPWRTEGPADLLVEWHRMATSFVEARVLFIGKAAMKIGILEV